MPRKKSDLSQYSRNAIRQRKIRQLSEQEREIAREKNRVSMERRRASQTQEEREAAREKARLEMRNRRANRRIQLMPLWTWECENSKCIPFHKKDVERLQSLPTCNMLCSSLPLWPQPTGPVSLSTAAVPVRADMFHLQTISAPSPTVTRHLKEAFQLFLDDLRLMEISEISARGYADWRTVAIHITVHSDKDPRMRINTDEGYNLLAKTMTDTSGALTVEINSTSFCGARHGLETLSQLVWLDPYEATLFMMSSATVKDSPKYGYRGIMVDTARNFIPLSDLIRTIDAMAYSKLNTFHWHVSDSQSFPLQLESLPELSRYDVYHNGDIYSIDDITKLVRRARLRGIRIIIEIDTPAHVSCAWNSWNLKHSNSPVKNIALCCDSQFCNDPPCGQLNPLHSHVYEILEAVYSEILQLTNVDDIIHIGGDDISEQCWKEELSHTHPKELWLKYTRTLLERLEMAYGKLPIAVIMWSSKYSDSFKKELKDFSSNIMLQIRSNTDQSFVSGIRTVMSDEPWDLNTGMGAWHEESNGIPYNSWQRIYEHRPWPIRDSGGRAKGGEATVWSWTLGGGGLDARIWPRGAALADRLWSDRPEGATRPVQARLDMHRSRLVARGIKASPLWSMWCTHNPYTCG